MPQTAAAGKTVQSVPRDLEPMFAPRSVAVVGASRRPGSVGHAVMRNLIYGGYTGVVYPVNPKAKSILTLRTVPSLTAIDDEVDLGVIVTPAPTIEGLVREGAEAGIRNFLIISAGFKEIGRPRAPNASGAWWPSRESAVCRSSGRTAWA